MVIVGSRFFIARSAIRFWLEIVSGPCVTATAELRAWIASLNARSFVGVGNLHGMKLEAQSSCCDLTFFPLWRRTEILRIPQHCNAGDLGKGFLEQLQSFAGENRGDVGESRNIPAGPREAINQPERNGITQV